MASKETEYKMEGVPDIGPFPGRQRFKEWKHEVLTASLNKFEFLTIHCEVIHSHIQSEVDPVLAKAASSGPHILKTQVSDYDDDTVWRVKLGGEYSTMLIAEKVECLNKWSRDPHSKTKNLC
eukprot:CAMPEP_0181293512 /NCGR_PEP_ID=MMETSP1101-20121128/3105_1 /TAXON_ID=46948 /ORGANISM="Rhodomonas abbreviata, Strain Caron Lab Isolate" /LENGTH=121 /DNA_ID=CAMNT_0023398105 /DNA_START=103 /DNA_END=468 /DNA_ORIENTATION=+